MSPVRVAVTALAVVAACLLGSAHAQFQDEIPLPAGGAGKAPVFQDEVQPGGDGNFGEVQPGVFAPKTEAPLKPPRRPFTFDNDAHLESELRETYRSLCGDARTLQFKDFDELVNKLLNPSDLNLYDEEKEHLKASVTAFKKQQGLHPETATATLYLGFVSRGAPLKFLRRLNKQLLDIRTRLRTDYLKNGREDLVKLVEGASMASGDGKKPVAMFEDELEEKGTRKTSPKKPAQTKAAPKAPKAPVAPASKADAEAPKADTPRRVRLDMRTGRKNVEVDTPSESDTPATVSDDAPEAAAEKTGARLFEDEL